MDNTGSLMDPRPVKRSAASLPGPNRDPDPISPERTRPSRPGMPIKGKFLKFNEDNIACAHSDCGVYALYEEAKIDTLIYIGRASGTGVTIRSKLRAHQRGHAGACTEQAAWFKQEIDSFPASRERQLIDEYKRTHEGQLPPCNDVKA